MADISNVINVSLIPEGQLAARDNMNVVAIMTSELVAGVLDTANRFQLYSNAADVASDLGSNSQANDFAQVFFSQAPNPINAGGILVVGFYRAAEENTVASAAVLTGAQITEATVVSQLQAVTDGTLDIDIDGATENLTTMDFQAVLDLDDIAEVIDDELSGGVASVDDQKIIITSSTTGATSLITVVTDPGTGTFIGNIVALAAGTGAFATQGADTAAIAL